MEPITVEASRTEMTLFSLCSVSRRQWGGGHQLHLNSTARDNNNNQATNQTVSKEAAKKQRNRIQSISCHSQDGGVVAVERLKVGR